MKWINHRGLPLSTDLFLNSMTCIVEVESSGTGLLILTSAWLVMCASSNTFRILHSNACYIIALLFEIFAPIICSYSLNMVYINHYYVRKQHCLDYIGSQIRGGRGDGAVRFSFRSKLHFNEES